MYYYRQISHNRRALAKALSVLLLLTTTTTPSFADPIPKKKEEMILWAFRNKTSELMFFGVDGKKRKTQVVKGGQSFVGLTEDGSHIIYIGKSGEPSSYQNDYTTFHIRSLDTTKVKDLNIPATRDGYHFKMSNDMKQAYGVKATKNPDGKVIHEYVYWDMQKMKMILLDVPENTRIFGFTPDNQSYYGIRFNTDELLLITPSRLINLPLNQYFRKINKK